MRKYRFFGGFIEAQEKWLNTMSNKGYRLIDSNKSSYDFIECEPSEYRYYIEFVAQKNADEVEEYISLLEDYGYKVIFKNINLNYSIGKVKWRPWANKGARIATQKNTYNKELLIVEKPKDGKEIKLHTTLADLENYYKQIRNPWLMYSLIVLAISIYMKSLILGLIVLIFIVPVIFYQYRIVNISKQKNIREW